MSKDFDVSDYITPKCVVIEDDVINNMSNDFYRLDLSFLKPKSCGTYIKTTSEELTRIIFDIISKYNIEVSVFPLVGFSRVKWYSRLIEPGEVLLALVPNSAENSAITFMGVVK